MAQANSTLDGHQPAPQPRGHDGGLAGISFRLYKSLLSPLIQGLSSSRCLYLPTCSDYAYTAVSRFGAVRGSWLALRRFSRCHPWGKGGLDPVPEQAACACAANSNAPDTVSKNADHLPYQQAEVARPQLPPTR